MTQEEFTDAHGYEAWTKLVARAKFESGDFLFPDWWKGNANILVHAAIGEFLKDQGYSVFTLLQAEHEYVQEGGQDWKGFLASTLFSDDFLHSLEKSAAESEARRGQK